MKILNLSDTHLTGSDRRRIKRLVRSKARWLRCDQRFVCGTYQYNSLDGRSWFGCFSAQRQRFGEGKGQWIVMTSEASPSDPRFVHI